MAENSRIEYKEMLTRELDIEKEIIAFLNYREGGEVYIGIDKNGNTIGLSDLDGDMLRIKDRIKNNICPSAMGLFTVSEETYDGKDIIKIAIASGSEKPYYKRKQGMTESGCYIRVGTAAEPMPQKMIDQLFSSRTRNSIGKIRSNRQDLTFEQLRIYYQENGKPLNNNFKRTLELVNDEGSYNYAAYLLADENNIFMKVAKYSSLDRSDLISNDDYGHCSLIKAAKNVLNRLETENITSATITSEKRNETPLWNRIAIKEAVYNAVVHNDYSFEIPPKFEIFPDRLEITSSGTLPDMLSKKELFEGISVPRNKELMRVFNDLHLVESLGSGIPRILKAYGEDCFVFMDNYTRVIFPNSNQDGNQDSNQDSNQDDYKLGKAFFLYSVGKAAKTKAEIERIVEQNKKQFDVWSTELSEISVKICSMCNDNSVSKTEIFKKLELTSQSKNVQKYLQPLLERKLLAFTIKDKLHSRHQRYYTTESGAIFLYYLNSKSN